LIRFLRSRNFFQRFSVRCRELESPESIQCFLTVLLHFSFLPVEVCVDLLTPILLGFLRKHVFSSIVEIQKLAIDCLKTMAEDSENSSADQCRRKMCVDFVIQDLSLFVLTTGERGLSGKCVDLISQLLSCDAAAAHLCCIRRTADYLLKKGDCRAAVRLLLFVAEVSPVGSQPFASPEWVRSILSVFRWAQADDDVALPCLKLFLCRTAYPEEAVVYFESGILRTLKECITGEPRRTSWVFWVIGNIVQNVTGALSEYFELGLFDVVSSVIGDCSYETRASVAVLLARIIAKKAEIEFVNDARVLVMLTEAVELLQLASERTVLLILEMCLTIVRLESAAGVAAFTEILREDGCATNLIALVSAPSQECATIATELCSFLDILP
jgi:hypothetical protein